ncbi:NDP-sugar pyrophosphorylase family protein [Catenibacillus scindens]|uniref:NDP-sugar pyrophosphorylase family protein n=1 Tax=Catenibacillus scindens TaxID=673271 RepID=A0A7W8HBV6_9FIRM|nr:sugar phosphate nucleotidyltransferase [Catenibacillus scindens]MBB5265113.1 NDP-sugar pyrophosphorylase family protein [Catenibacillus scindens]
MREPVLVIMAAGMGSRYGGLKQIDPLNAQGDIIIDFSIYDAMRAGFKKVIFIIKRELEQDFREKIGNKIAPYMDVEYVYQEIDNIPEGYSVPEERVKPWGTGHAVLSCIQSIHGPFAVINADDFYGRHAFETLYRFLKDHPDDKCYRYGMVGYRIENTLTDFGYVSRGVCKTDDQGMLMEIQERTHIEKKEEGAAFTEDDGRTWTKIPSGSIVSMNMWGFNESLLSELKNRFSMFLDKGLKENPLKCEYYLPGVVGELLAEKKATVNVLPSEDRWYGVTYREDKPVVVKAIEDMKARGDYPQVLWPKHK